MEQNHTNLDTLIAKLGENINEVVKTAISVEDVRLSRTKSLEFMPNEEGSASGLGVFWKEKTGTKQLVLRDDRVFSSENFDLQHGKYFSIGNLPILREEELGASVRKSSLVEVGTLKNLQTQGNLNVDGFIFYDSGLNRLGIGTEEANASLSVVSLDSEFIIDVEGSNTRIGNWTTDDLEIITDNTARITVTSTGKVILGTNNESHIIVNGHLGIGINNPPHDTSITTAQGIRFSGTKFEVGRKAPDAGGWKKGDIVWNSDPKPTGYVGWICVKDGTPGVWKPFGQISS
jgi:hypothetical protein